MEVDIEGAREEGHGRLTTISQRSELRRTHKMCRHGERECCEGGLTGMGHSRTDLERN